MEMEKDDLPTLDQEVYGALRDDLKEKKHVDMVFSYFNDVRGKVEYSTSCHRMALAAKSRLLHRIFLLHNGDLSLIIVGSGEMTPAEDLIGILYNPEKSGKDITLWDDDGIKLDPVEVKPEQGKELDIFHSEDEKGSTVNDEEDWELEDQEQIKKKKRSPNVKDTKGLPGIDIGSFLKLSSREKRHLEGIKRTLGLSLERMERLVKENADAIGFHEYKQDRWGRFNALTYDGTLLPYSCCKDCRVVIQ